MSDSIEISVICMNTGYEICGTAHSVMMSKTSSVSHLKAVIQSLLPPTVGDIVISTFYMDVFKILSPVPPPVRNIDQYPAPASEDTTQHGYKTRGATRTFEQLLQELQKGFRESQGLIKLLSPLANLGAEFKDLPAEKIHAIVLISAAPSSNTIKQSQLPANEKDIPRLHHLYKLTASSPPSACLGENGEKVREQVLAGRPAGRFAFPVAIYNKPLADLSFKLKRIADSSDEAENLFHNADQYVMLSKNFLAAAVKHHESEGSRTKASEPFLSGILGPGREVEFNISRVASSQGMDKVMSRAKADMAFVTDLDLDGKKVQIPRVIIEIKRYEGEGDPFAQSIKDYGEIVYGFKKEKFFNSTCFPMLFICLNGHNLVIYAAVSLDYVVVDELLRIPLIDDIQSETRIGWLARMASALSQCSTDLNGEYKKLEALDHTLKQLPPFFPQPTFDPSASESSDVLSKLTYRGFIGKDGIFVEKFSNPTPADMRSVLVADMDADNDGGVIEVVVKFTPTYNKEAHELLAHKQLAPRLRCCCRVLGDLFMVVMDRVEGMQLSSFEESDLKPSVLQDLRNVVTELGEANLVHGDLRAVNIIVDSSGEHAKVIDFDWVSKVGKRYPALLNKSELHDQWHPEVDSYKPMKKAHDKYAVQKVLAPKYFG